MITRFNEKEVRQLINGCLNQELESQQKLYKRFYGFAMSICLRYAGNRYDAADIINDGFLKIFINLHKYDHSKPFQAWLGKIMMNTSIDHYRAKLKYMHTQDLTMIEDIGQEATINQSLNYDDLVRMVQQLPPSYRAVFNLFAIDGYSHEEISTFLGISVGASKSNLFKARQKLQAAVKRNTNPRKESTEEVKIIPINHYPTDNMTLFTGLES